MAYSKFHSYLLNSLTVVQMQELVNDGTATDRINSSNKLVRIQKNPRIADLEEVLFFAERLGINPYILVKEYELGADKLTQREIKLLIKEQIKEELEPAMLG
jgi:hypothetical protein